MPLIHRGRYWFADLFNDFTGDFFVLYLRGLDGFDFGGHLVTSYLECIKFFGVKQVDAKYIQGNISYPKRQKMKSTASPSGALKLPFTYL
jgi:hypothetical protein